MSKSNGSRDAARLIIIHGDLSNARMHSPDGVKLRWYSRATQQRMHVASDAPRFISRIVQDLAEHRSVVVYTASQHTALDLPGRVSRICDEYELDVHTSIFTPRGLPDSVCSEIQQMSRWGIVLFSELQEVDLAATRVTR